MKKFFYLSLACLTIIIPPSCNREEESDPTEVDPISDWENDFSHSIADRYTQKVISVRGTPYNPKVHGNYVRYPNLQHWWGKPTYITVVTVENDLHVLWIDQNQDVAVVSVFNQNLNKTKSTLLIEKPAVVSGFTVIPNQGYAIVYTDKSSVDETHLKITDFDGKELHKEFVVGNTDRSIKGARWTDLKIEGRLTYNKSLERLAFYTAEFGQWSNDPDYNDVHQAGLFKTFDKSGNTTFTKDWFKGHIFGVRLAELNDVSIIGINSDANPLGVGCVAALPHNIFNDVEVFKCSQGLGAYIETRIGNVVAFPENDQYAVSYTGQEVVASTESFDVGVSFYTPSGMRISNLILPRPEGKEGKACGINPLKMARFGDDKVLLAWVEKEWENPEEIEAYFAISNSNGELMLGPEPMGDLAFHLTDEFFVYPNGHVGWVEGDGNQLRFHTVRVQ